MALSKRLLLIIGSLFVLFLSFCDKTPSDTEPDEPTIPSSVNIISPSAANTYWTDKAIPCKTNEPDYADQTTWLVNGEAVSCTDDELIADFAAGDHTVTARIADEDESIEKSVTITVKEGFSVTLNEPADASTFFVGDQLACDATVSPETYADALEITVGEDSCTDGTAELRQSGEATVTATVAVDGRSETDAATVSVQPAIAGKIYPMTDRGVSTSAGGFAVTLEASGNTATVETAADGSFSIKADLAADLGAEEVTLAVAETCDFYGARAVLPGDELVALVEANELGFILAPRSWTIRDGELAGSTTSIKLRAAFTRADPEDQYSSFYWLQKVFGKYKYISVSSENIPIKTAFNRAESATSITASDSTDFWQQTDDVTESYVGRGNLFAPATIAEVPGIEDGIRVRSLSAATQSSASSIPGDVGYIVGGFMRLAIDKFGGYRQTHEQIHNLGFGHAHEWAGIMSIGSFSADLSKASVNDIAHIQVYIDTFSLQYSEGISFGVLEWMQALDIDGLPKTNSSQTEATGKHTASSYLHEMVECDFH